MKKVICFFCVLTAISFSFNTSVNSNDNRVSGIETSYHNMSGTTTLNLKCFIQGLYLNNTHSESIRVVLRDATTHAVESSQFVTLPINGIINGLTCNIPLTGNYYISIWYENAIETCSKLGGEHFTIGGTTDFDFSAPVTNAFGSNEYQVNYNPDLWGAFSGDVDQDNIIDGTDLMHLDNDRSHWLGLGVPLSGLPTDLNVNGGPVNNIDITICDDNALNYVMKVTPW